LTDTRDLGLDLAALGFLISLVGVVENNLLLNHITAMIVWCPSNAIFCLYFFGRVNKWWDGGVSDWLLCCNYAFMLVSGLMGLKQAGII
jgi:hypothetical protein